MTICTLFRPKSGLACRVGGGQPQALLRRRRRGGGPAGVGLARAREDSVLRRDPQPRCDCSRGNRAGRARQVRGRTSVVLRISDGGCCRSLLERARPDARNSRPIVMRRIGDPP
jgi:hypothetical protein